MLLRLHLVSPLKKPRLVRQRSNNASIKQLLSEKNAAHAAKLKNLSSTALHQKWKELRSHAQKELCEAENKWWTDKANEIQFYADTKRHRSSMTQLKQHTAPGITPFTPSEPKMVLP